MLKYPVYVQNITNLSDARYCAGMGVAYLGFCFDVHSGFSQTQYYAIKGWLSGVAFVAEFYDSNLDYILKTIEEIKPDFVLLDAKNHAWQSQIHIPIIFRFDVKENLHFFVPKESLVLVCSSNINDNITNYGGLIKQLVHDYSYKLFLSFNFDNHQIDTIFSTYLPFGIALTGEDEEAPGLKNFDHLSTILESIEI